MRRIRYITLNPTYMLDSPVQCNYYFLLMGNGMGIADVRFKLRVKSEMLVNRD